MKKLLILSLCAFPYIQSEASAAPCSESTRSHGLGCEERPDQSCDSSSDCSVGCKCIKAAGVTNRRHCGHK